MANNFKEEPKTAPQPDRWYDLSLGSSFKEDASNKFCTLRYEFRPASIDKSKPGALHKNKGNRVSVEFQNNQLGRPKVHFEGSSEEYKGDDAVLFFDGHTFRLERLHRAVKQLRHLREPGESAAGPSGGGDPRLSPPVGKGGKPPQIAKPAVPSFPVEVERIDFEKPPIPASRFAGKGIDDNQIEPPKVPDPSSPKNSDETKEHCDIDIDDIFGSTSPYDDDGMTTEDKDIDVGPAADNNAPPEQHQNDSDDEIADVDDSGDEEHKGRINAAEALKAQVNNAADGGHDDDNQSSSSGSSSGSGSSGSGSGSGSNTSSDSEGSDDDVTSI